MTAYVLGFMFDKDANVALIRKTRPTWQAGRLNGIGGHIEVGESRAGAMAREFFEETGVDTDPAWWRLFATMHSGQHTIYCFTMRRLLSAEEVPLLSGPEGAVNWHDSTSPGGRPDELPNLKWLIPMALMDNVQHADVYYPNDPLDKK